MSKPYVTTWVKTHLHVVLKGGNNDKPGTPAVLNLGYQGIGQWFPDCGTRVERETWLWFPQWGVHLQEGGLQYVLREREALTIFHYWADTYISLPRQFSSPKDTLPFSLLGQEGWREEGMHRTPAKGTRCAKSFGNRCCWAWHRPWLIDERMNEIKINVLYASTGYAVWWNNKQDWFSVI